MRVFWSCTLQTLWNLEKKEKQLSGEAKKASTPMSGPIARGRTLLKESLPKEIKVSARQEVRKAQRRGWGYRRWQTGDRLWDPESTFGKSGDVGKWWELEKDEHMHRCRDDYFDNRHENCPGSVLSGLRWYWGAYGENGLVSWHMEFCGSLFTYKSWNKMYCFLLYITYNLGYRICI